MPKLTLASVNLRISTLQKLANKIAAAEGARLEKKVKKVKALMKKLGVTIEDLGGRKGGAGRKGKGLPSAIKFRDPATGAGWTGKGRPPGWFVAALKAGRSREDLAVKGAK